MSGPERSFRSNRVVPFLRTLKNTKVFPIHQKSFSGHPDFILCIRGKFVALELKSLTGVLSPLQKYTLKDIEDRGGGLSFVANPDNWDEVREQLFQLDKGE